MSFAFRLAHERMRTKPACSALFARLGADGFQLLARAHFAPATIEKDRNACASGAAARTEINGRQIRLCPAFAALSPGNAALILIHELLHDAGMSEKPADPNGPKPQQINQMVKVSCNL